MAEGDASRSLRFALAKFRPATLPATLVTRSALRDQLTAGAGQRLTMVVGSAGAGRACCCRGDHGAAREHLRAPSLGELTPRRALVRQVLLAAAAIGRGDPMTASIVAGVLQEARRGGFLKLLPTSTYLQMADTLYISHNTVKVHLRSVYQKLGVTSRSQAIQRAVDLRLL